MGSVYPSILEGSSSIHGAREGKIRHDQPRGLGQTGRAAPRSILVVPSDCSRTDASAVVLLEAKPRRDEYRSDYIQIDPVSFPAVQRGRAGGPLIGGGFGLFSPDSPLRNR